MTDSIDFQLVSRVLLDLEENFREQPSLDDLALSAGVSKFHLQRLFTRWAGVSPKRFLQFLTIEHAKALLEESTPVLAAAFASGLSGPARLHDLFVSVEGVTPGEYKNGGEALEIRYGVHPTPFGEALLGMTMRGLCHLAFLPPGQTDSAGVALQTLEENWPGARVVEGPEATGPVAASLFDTERTYPPAGALSLFVKGTNFQLKVWSALLRIPEGSVTTYGRLASALGAPGSARALGAAVGKNPIAYLIPCHRVIREMGSFGEYRWGTVRKKAILGWEAARKAS